MRSSVSKYAEQAQNNAKTFENTLQIHPHQLVGRLSLAF